MTSETFEEIASSLSLLVSSSTVSGRDLETAKRLLTRMSAPVQVALLGPDKQTAETVLPCLQESKVPKMTVGYFETGQYANADIALWCTRMFGPSEQTEWENVPNTLKDHSFLIAYAPQSDQVSHLERLAEEEFVALYLLDPSSEATGLAALQRDVEALIEQGLQAIRDGAHLFVQKHRAKIPMTAPQPKPAPEEAPTATPIEADLKPRSEPIFQKALSLLTDQSDEVSAIALSDETTIGESALQLCSNMSDALMDIFSASDSDQEDFVAMREMVFQAADHIMLMSLENDLGSAADAATVLLQIRKDISVCQSP